jgi:hypothetical protein
VQRPTLASREVAKFKAHCSALPTAQAGASPFP